MQNLVQVVLLSCQVPEKIFTVLQCLPDIAATPMCWLCLRSVLHSDHAADAFVNRELHSTAASVVARV